MNSYQSGFSEWIEQFVAYRKAPGMWNEGNHGCNIRYFDRYCAEYYPGMPLCQEMVDSWCSRRSTETNASCDTRIQGIRAFIRYLRERQLSDVNPPPRMKCGKSTYLPHVFGEDELRRFFDERDHVVSLRPEKKYKMKQIVCPVFFRSLYSSGIRTTEARYLKRDDVDLIHGVLNIRKSKGYDQHYVALHESMTELLARYDRAADRVIPSRTYFFETPNGTYYSRQWVTATFRTLWLKANGANGNAVPYALRHNYAVTNINQWPDDTFEFTERLHCLSKSMGHRNIDATLHYYSIVPRLADILREKTGKGMDAILPEAPDEE